MQIPYTATYKPLTTPTPTPPPPLPQLYDHLPVNKKNTSIISLLQMCGTEFDLLWRFEP